MTHREVSLFKLHKRLTDGDLALKGIQAEFTRLFVDTLRNLKHVKEATDTFFVADEVLEATNAAVTALADKSKIGSLLMQAIMSSLSDASLHFVFKRHVRINFIRLYRVGRAYCVIGIQI